MLKPKRRVTLQQRFVLTTIARLGDHAYAAAIQRVFLSLGQQIEAYNILRALEDHGLVTSYLGEIEPGARWNSRKRYYHPTPLASEYYLDLETCKVPNARKRKKL